MNQQKPTRRQRGFNKKKIEKSRISIISNRKSASNSIVSFLLASSSIVILRSIILVRFASRKKNNPEITQRIGIPIV
ncbi:unnamed protein product [Caenorhabditis angaria]|uniref:Uncharacterized protein n=1 Tax=Caenorhabditis angaria TaxID=860376 RepID=A0A9P1N8C4_9PELO|nr:unnamed protein product [Caenorhabditis angaria]